MDAEKAPRRKTVGNGSGSVFQVGSRSGTPGPWVAQVKSDGKFRRTYHPSQAKATRALRSMLAAIETGGSIPNGNATVNDLLQPWLDKVVPSQNLSAITLDTYKWACKILCDDLGSIRLKGLTADHIEAAFEARATAGMSRASLSKLRSVLGKALDYAQRRGMTNQNVARIAELPATARRQVEGRSLTAEQANQLLQHTKGQPLHALWTVMLYLGLRPGEATGLTWRDVDFDGAIIHIRRSRKLERGKLIIDERLKTSRSRRSLDAPPPVINALRAHQHLQHVAEEQAGLAWNNGYDLVFTTSVGTPHSPRNLQRSLATVTTQLGFGVWHPHELRHTAASLMSEAGIPIERIADQLGHDGTRMALLVYRHATKPTVNAANALVGVLGGE